MLLFWKPVLQHHSERRFVQNVIRAAKDLGHSVVVAHTSDGAAEASLKFVRLFPITQSVFRPASELLRDELRRLNPSHALVHNDLLPLHESITSILRDLGTQVRFLERSPVTSNQWIESESFYGRSSLFRSKIFDAPRQISCRECNLIVFRLRTGSDFRYSARRRLASSVKNPVPTDPYILFLMDNTLVTKWGNKAREGSVQGDRDALYPDVHSPLEAVSIALDIARERGVKLVLRFHPSHQSSELASLSSDCIVSNSPMLRLVRRSSGVLTGVSKSVLTAHALGIPAVAMGVNSLDVRQHLPNSSFRSRICEFRLNQGLAIELVMSLVHAAHQQVWPDTNLSNGASGALREFLEAPRVDSFQY